MTIPSHLWDQRWTLFVALAAISAGLGYWGFRDVDDSASVLTLAYRTVQLSVLQSGDVGEAVPLQLNVARFLAPIVAAAAAVTALIAIASERVELLRVGRLRGHTIVCGLGDKGALLVRACRDRDKAVVAIERNPSDEFVEGARLIGAFVIVGDAQNKEVLRRAGAGRAAHLVAVCGSDSTNAEVAIQARTISEGRRGAALTCMAHIVDPRASLLLRTEELARPGPAGFRLDFFNIYEAGAQALLRDHPPFTSAPAGQSATPQMLVVGLGQLGEAIAVHAARSWRYVDEQQRPLTILIAEDDADRKVDALRHRYDDLSSAWDLVPVPLATASAASSSDISLDKNSRLASSTIAYVCAEDDQSTLSVGLSLQHRLGSSQSPVVLVLTRSAGLAGLITQLGNLTEYESLRAFGLLDRTLTVDLLLHGTYEVLARAMHSDYVKAQIDEGQTRDTNPSMALWESLPGHLKESNRAQAGHIGEKLRAVDCTLIPIMDSTAASFEFSDAEIEALAQMEHERWLAERRDNGWQYIDGPKDTEKKLNPDLVPWEDLNKDAKDKDRVFIRGLPLLLARAGFQVIRRERTAMFTETPGQK